MENLHYITCHEEFVKCVKVLIMLNIHAGEGNGNPIFLPEEFKVAWWLIVHGVIKSQT